MSQLFNRTCPYGRNAWHADLVTRDMLKKPTTHRRAFTLIELLVVLAILGILMALLFPVFRAANESGLKASCLNRFHQLGIAELVYAHDNNDTLVPRVTETGTGEVHYDTVLRAYTTDARLWSCDSAHPSDPANTRSIGMNRAMATSYDGTNPNPRPVTSGLVADLSTTILLSEDVAARPGSLAPSLLRAMTNPNGRNACLSEAQRTQGRLTNDIGRALTRHSGQGNYGRMDGSAGSLPLSATLSPKVRWFANGDELKKFVGTNPLSASNCTAVGLNSPYPGTDPVTGN